MKALPEQNLIFEIKSALNFKSQGNENIELFPQGTYNFQKLWNETLVTAD